MKNPNNHLLEKITRRQFIVSSAYMGAGLSLGMYISGCNDNKKTIAQTSSMQRDLNSGANTFAPNAFVRIEPDNTVTLIMKHFEMGQGTFTGLATLLAEELDADWSQIRVEAAPANKELYKNNFWGAQGTGGSTSIANSYEQMRKAGATAKAMLVSAAAKQWQVPAGEIRVENGVIAHQASGKSANFGELSSLAAKEEVPQDVFLKNEDEFRLIGKKIDRKDTMPKTTGKAIYTQDVKLPNMLTAVVAHAPRFGGKLKSYDDSAAIKMKNVEAVVQIPTGVAVLANDYWSAYQGRQALKLDWDETQAIQKSSAQLMEEYKNLAKQDGAAAVDLGDTKKALSSAGKILSAAYEFPYLAHASMEPLNCVVQIGDNSCEIWNADQSQTRDQDMVAQTLGIKPDQVKINTLFAGGSFGRRANPQSDYVVEAANIAKALGQAKPDKKETPVKLVWSREDDMLAGYYRPMYYHEINASLDKKGMPLAWHHKIVGQSILDGSSRIKDGIDPTSVEGAANLPYDIPNLLVELHTTRNQVPVQWWRSVGSTHTAYATETFIDQLATLAEKDPLEYRRALLQKQPRHLGVLNLAAEKSGWGKTLGPGKGRGIAVHKSFNTYVAQVAEVSVNKDNSFSVDRVVIAVDCGLPINPDIISAQMEGGMGFGLAMALSSAITLKDGKVEQSNFDTYQVVRMKQMPKIVEVHIVQSDQPPTGVGEPGTPVIAPAVANALSSVTGKRYFQLPIKLG